MTPELILLALGAAGAGGIGGILWSVERRARQRYINHVRTEWARTGRVVQFGPVGAITYGSQPRRLYRHGIFGALGLVDDSLVFVGHRSSRYDTALPLDTLRWIGLAPVAVTRGRATRRVRALVIHATPGITWTVHPFLALDQPHAMLDALAQHAGLTPVTSDDPVDFGPNNATRLFQDIYGEWITDRAAPLYLAPDRLLFGGRDAIPLVNIQRLDVIHDNERGTLGALNPWPTHLLRLEHAHPADNLPQVTGFLVRGADRWAEAIAHRADAPIIIRSGRKKKAD